MTDKAQTLSPLQEELLKRADSIFDSIAKTVSETKDFVVEQLPDIAVQYVTFYRAYYTFEIIFSILFLVLGLYLLVNIAIRNTFKYPITSYDVDYRRVWAAGAGILMILPSFISFMNTIKSFFLVWFAPKIFLIQTIVTLIKGGSV